MDNEASELSQRLVPLAYQQGEGVDLLKLNLHSSHNERLERMNLPRASQKCSGSWSLPSVLKLRWRSLYASNTFQTLQTLFLL